MPHARIRGIDARDALATDGVRAVLTGKDFPIPFGILPVSQDEHALCLDKVRFVGDRVAFVAAETAEIAEQTLRLIDVEYEELAKVTNIEEATAPGAVQVHEGGVARADATTTSTRCRQSCGALRPLAS